MLLLSILFQAIGKQLKLFALEVHFDNKKSVFMSDRGSNIIKALERHDVVFCFRHRMNNMLQRSFYQVNSKQIRQSAIVGTRIESNDSMNVFVSSTEDSVSGDEKISKRASPSKQPEAVISLTELPSRAKDLLDVITPSKSLVKYVKVVCVYD